MARPDGRILAILKVPLRRLGHCAWALNARLPRRTFKVRDKATVLIPCYSAERVSGVGAMVRSIFRCAFVDRVVVSNHNPAVRIEDHLRIADDRLQIVNQPIRRGCGYGWMLARALDPEFLICIDDDLRLFPGQLAGLFKRLVAEPAVPHGLVGHCGAQFHQNREMEVDNLNQVYAVTGAHLRVYAELIDALTRRALVASDAIELWGDDIVLSHSGAGRPKIHDIGPILRCATANDPRLATHRQPGFQHWRDEIRSALVQIRPDAVWDRPAAESAGVPALPSVE